jgi:hypothetical protein
MLRRNAVEIGQTRIWCGTAWEGKTFTVVGVLVDPNGNKVFKISQNGITMPMLPNTIAQYSEVTDKD